MMSQSDKIRVVDRLKHTLFYYNRHTHCIEIKTPQRGGNHATQGEFYAVNIEYLLALSQDGDLIADLENIFVASLLEMTR